MVSHSMFVFNTRSSLTCAQDGLGESIARYGFSRPLFAAKSAAALPVDVEWLLTHLMVKLQNFPAASKACLVLLVVWDTVVFEATLYIAAWESQYMLIFSP